MKILFVSDSTSKSNSAYYHRIKMLRSGLKDLGVETNVVFMGDMPIRHPRILRLLNLSFLKGLRGYDYVHAGSTPCAFACAVCKCFMKAKVIYDMHGDIVSEMRLYWRPLWNIRKAFHYLQAIIMERFAIRYSDYYIVPSKPLQSLLLARKVPSANIEIVRNGVETGVFRPLSQTDDKPHKQFLITYAGNMQLWQGLDNLIDAFKSLKGNIKLQVIGFRDSDAQIKHSISEALHDRVELIDRLPQDMLIKILSQSDALIIPRKRHPAIAVAFPTKFAEYVSLGKPVIVTDVDETAEVVRKHKCGIVCDPDPHSLGAAIDRMVSLDENTRRLMGQNGRKLALKSFDWRVISAGYFKWLLHFVRPQLPLP
jgi:glycosyltransferase involved in cell wall biosynthesis